MTPSETARSDAPVAASPPPPKPTRRRRTTPTPKGPELPLAPPEPAIQVAAAAPRADAITRAAGDGATPAVAPDLILYAPSSGFRLSQHGRKTGARNPATPA